MRFRLTAKEATALALFLESKKQRMALACGGTVALEFDGDDERGWKFFAECENRKKDLTDYDALEELEEDL